MQIAFHNDFEAQGQIASIVGERVTIGRAPENDIVLSSPFVALQAAVLDKTSSGWRVIALGKNGCDVNGRTILPGEQAPVGPTDPIRIFPFTLTLDGTGNWETEATGLCMET